MQRYKCDLQRSSYWKPEGGGGATTRQKAVGERGGGRKGVYYTCSDTHTKSSTDLRLCLLTLFKLMAPHTLPHTHNHSHTHMQTLHSIWQRRTGTTHDSDDDVTQLKMPWRKLLNALAWRMENGEWRMEDGDEAECNPYREREREEARRSKWRGASHLHTLKMRKVNDCARKKPLELWALSIIMRRIYSYYYNKNRIMWSAQFAWHSQHTHTARTYVCVHVYWCVKGSWCQKGAFILYQLRPESVPKQ